MSSIEHELPQNWAMATLGELGTWSGGGTPSKANRAFWENGSIPWVSPKDMKFGRIRSSENSITEDALDQSSAKLIPANSILMVTRSGILAHSFPVAVNEPEVTVNQDLKTLTPANGINPDFLTWYLRSQNFRILKECAKHGTTVASIDTDRLKSFSVPVAPTNQQHRIVEKIETLFAQIDKGEEALREVQKLLKRYRQSILKAAVTGELTRDWREANQDKLEPASDLLNRILKARRENWQGRGKYKEPVEPGIDELPDLPKGWAWATVDQVTSIFRNGLSKRPVAEPNGLPILRISAVRPLSVSLEDLRYYPVSEQADIDQFWVERGDLLFTRYSGSARFVGVCGQLRDHIQVLHPDKLIKARPVSGAVLNTDYLELAWNTGWTRKHIAANIKTTSGQQGIAGADIKMSPFALPPLEEQEVIVERAWEAMEGIALLESACQSELVRSTNLRQSVLRSAFTGQLVPQDAADEPASELLARIRSEHDTAAEKSSDIKVKA